MSRPSYSLFGQMAAYHRRVAERKLSEPNVIPKESVSVTLRTSDGRMGHVDMYPADVPDRWDRDGDGEIISATIRVSDNGELKSELTISADAWRELEDSSADPERFVRNARTVGLESALRAELDLFDNEYDHEADGTSWTDQHSCECNDKCPTCGAEVEPTDSTMIRGLVEGDDGVFRLMSEAEPVLDAAPPQAASAAGAGDSSAAAWRGLERQALLNAGDTHNMVVVTADRSLGVGLAKDGGKLKVVLHPVSPELTGISRFNSADASEVRDAFAQDVPEHGPYSAVPYGQLARHHALVQEAVLAVPEDSPKAEASTWDAFVAAGVAVERLNAMEADGGYVKILASSDLSLKWQDVLDSALVERVVAVRNALRVLGWEGEHGEELTKGVGSEVSATLRLDFRQVGAGRNIVSASYAAVLSEQGVPVDADAKRSFALRDAMTEPAESVAVTFDQEVTNAIERRLHATKAFEFEGKVYSPDEAALQNANDPTLLQWFDSAQVGDAFDGASAWRLMCVEPLHKAEPTFDDRYSFE